MKLFIQGMRRSGTTILFDTLAEDPEFDIYYEPFAAARNPAIGGGSGARQVDYFEKIRACRAAFQQQYPQTIAEDYLNYGAPRDALLEFEPDLPPPCRGYVRYMIDQRPHTVIKFTRLYTKVAALAEIEPQAKFIHLVRDPRAVTASYLFGKGRRNAREFSTESACFDRTTTRTAWSSFPLSEHILSLPEYRRFAGCEDFFRVMLIWAFTFRTTRQGGLAAFGQNYRLVRHEDLQRDPAAAIHAIYQFLERPLPPRVRDWAQANIRPGGEFFAAANPRWRHAIDRLNLAPEMEAAGYPVDAPSLISAQP